MLNNAWVEKLISEGFIFCKLYAPVVDCTTSLKCSQQNINTACISYGLDHKCN